MLKAFLNIWKIPELRNKIAFTFGMLAIYRLGFFVPLPGVDVSDFLAAADRTDAGVLAYLSMFTGGKLTQATIFGLGIMPYISAAIIFQLLTSVLPSLQELQKEGPAGRQKIQEYTRYATVGLSFIQGAFMLKYLTSFAGLVLPEFAQGSDQWIFWMCGVLGLMGGAVFLMWLGEQIDKYGIGNGASLIITAGIVTGMPDAIRQIAQGFSFQSGANTYSPMMVIFLALAFIVVVAGAILITQGQRRIPIQQAKHTRGRRVFGGQRSYLPLRVNHGGVMPIIFASALLMFPVLILEWLSRLFQVGWLDVIVQGFAIMSGYLYIVTFVAMIYFFAFFWTSVQFQPKEMASNLRDHGSFVPGLRPGPRTAEYLENVMERITYVGAGFLSVIAVIPAIVTAAFNIDYFITAFLGGTGLLIVVSVMLDLVTRIEATLSMRNFPGFLGGGKAIRGSRSGPT